MYNSLSILGVINKKFALSEEDAQQIFPSLEQAISSKTPLNLSFNGIETCSTIFLNNSLGRLYLSHGIAVDTFIHFVDIDSTDTVTPYKLERLRKRALKPEFYQPIFKTAIGEA